MDREAIIVASQYTTMMDRYIKKNANSMSSARYSLYVQDINTTGDIDAKIGGMELAAINFLKVVENQIANALLYCNVNAKLGGVAIDRSQLKLVKGYEAFVAEHPDFWSPKGKAADKQEANTFMEISIGYPDSKGIRSIQYSFIDKDTGTQIGSLNAYLNVEWPAVQEWLEYAKPVEIVELKVLTNKDGEECHNQVAPYTNGKRQVLTGDAIRANRCASLEFSVAKDASICLLNIDAYGRGVRLTGTSSGYIRPLPEVLEPGVSYTYPPAGSSINAFVLDLCTGWEAVYILAAEKGTDAVQDLRDVCHGFAEVENIPSNDCTRRIKGRFGGYSRERGFDGSLSKGSAESVTSLHDMNEYTGSFDRELRELKNMHGKNFSWRKVLIEHTAR
jgi:hypothetical protein